MHCHVRRTVANPTRQCRVTLADAFLARVGHVKARMLLIITPCGIKQFPYARCTAAAGTCHLLITDQRVSGGGQSMNAIVEPEGSVVASNEPSGRRSGSETSFQKTLYSRLTALAVADMPTLTLVAAMPCAGFQRSEYERRWQMCEMVRLVLNQLKRKTPASRS